MRYLVFVIALSWPLAAATTCESLANLALPHSTVTLAEADGKTKLTVHTKMVGLAPIAAQMLEGMEAGWTQSLERLRDLAEAAEATSHEATARKKSHERRKEGPTDG